RRSGRQSAHAPAASVAEKSTVRSESEGSEDNVAAIADATGAADSLTPASQAETTIMEPSATLGPPPRDAAPGHWKPSEVAPHNPTRRKLMPRRKPDRPLEKPELRAPPPHEEWPGLEGVVAAAVAACRSARVPLSLLCLEITGYAELVFALRQQSDAVR